MRERELIEALCKLTSKIAGDRFSWNIPADCFCSDRKHESGDRFQFDREILNFITAAIDSKLAAERGKA